MTGLILPHDTRAKGVVAFIAREQDGMIQVIDLLPTMSPDAQRDLSPVTAAPQTVLNELALRGFPINDRPIIYLDHEIVPHWDVIKVHNGQFDNFCVIHATSWAEALRVLLDSGYITKRDLKRDAVVSGRFTGTSAQ